MNKGVIRLLALVLGIFFLIAVFYLDNQLLRIILLSLSIILFIVFNVIERTHKKLAIIIFTFILLFLAQVFDYIAIKYFNKEPLLVYSIIEDNNVRVFNSVFYRVWQCDLKENSYIIDNLEKMGYFCNVANLDSTNINTYAVELITNYDKYVDTFIKVKGIVVDVTDDYFLLKSYIIKDEQVIFNNNLILKVYTNATINNVNINDSVEVSGRVGKKEDKEILLEDCVIY